MSSWQAHSGNIIKLGGRLQDDIYITILAALHAHANQVRMRKADGFGNLCGGACSTRAHRPGYPAKASFCNRCRRRIPVDANASIASNSDREKVFSSPVA